VVLTLHVKKKVVKVLPGKSTAILRFIHPPVYVGEIEGNVEGMSDSVGDSDGNFVSVGAGEIVGSKGQNGTSQ
jgi:hypothetical protein